MLQSISKEINLIHGVLISLDKRVDLILLPIVFFDSKISMCLFLLNITMPGCDRIIDWISHGKSNTDKKMNRRWVGDWTFAIYNVYGRRNPFNVYYTQRKPGVDTDVFLGSPLGTYELSIMNSPLFALTYNFVFD